MSRIYRVRPQKPRLFFERLEAGGWKVIDWFEPPWSYLGGTDVKEFAIFREYLEKMGFEGGYGPPKEGSLGHTILNEWVWIYR